MVDNATEFDRCSGIAIARLFDPIKNYKKGRIERSTILRRSSSPRSARCKLRWPKLNLPIFSGSYPEWISFFDLFNAAVNSNTQLSDSEKLNNQRACLKGDTAKFYTGLCQVYTASVLCNDGCNEEHKSHECQKFKRLSIAERLTVVKIKPECYNCLHLGHNVNI